MAEEVEMTPVAGAEPPTVDLANKIAPNPALKDGLKLPPKPGPATGLKLPPKPSTTASALRPGLKLPTQPALKPGVRLPSKPVIRKPGSTVSAAPLPKPVTPAAAAPAAEAPMEQLKSVTQKMKGVTQEIPQQAILRKTGIIADEAMSEAQKAAAKHKTARISLSDAMGVAPVKNDAAPMKTIRIKRPISLPTSPAATAAAAPAAATAPAAPAAAPAAAEPSATGTKPVSFVAPSAATITQRKTLKISRPGGTAVKPSGKFGVKRPATQATTIVKAAPAAPADGAVADIPDIPNLPMAPMAGSAPASDDAGALVILSTIVQLAACVAIGALAWFLYQNTQISYF